MGHAIWFLSHRERSLKDLISGVNKGTEKLRDQTHGSVTMIRTVVVGPSGLPRERTSEQTNRPTMPTVCFPGNTSYGHNPDDLGVSSHHAHGRMALTRRERVNEPVKGEGGAGSVLPGCLLASMVSSRSLAPSHSKGPEPWCSSSRGDWHLERAQS